MKKNTKNLISVIMPVRNRHSLFLKTFQSVVRQKLTDYNFEIILVDDGSSPAVDRFIRNQFKNIPKGVSIVRNKVSKGPSFSRNIGLKKARGGYIAFLDSDDIYHPLFLNSLAKKLNSDKSQVVTSFLQPVFQGDFSFFAEFYYLLLSFSRMVCFLGMYFLNKGELSTSFFYMTRLSGMMFTKKSIKGVKFSEEYKLAEDWKFLLDCIKANKISIQILPKFLVDFLYHKDSETIGKIGYWNYYYNLIDEIPRKMKNNFGFQFFKIYANLSAQKEKWLTILS